MKKDRITFRLTPKEYEKLMALITVTDNGSDELTYAGQPSQSKFFKKIINGEIAIKPFIPKADNETTLEMLIKKEQPFRISNYRDITGLLWTFDVEYADFWVKNDKRYLRIYSENAYSPDPTKTNIDIPELRNNWCLLPSRSPEMEITPITTCNWRREGLDKVVAEIEVYGSLAYWYNSPKHIDDLCVGDIINGVRVIKREFWSSFWLKKDLHQYYPEVVVRFPEELRFQIAQETESLLQKYTNLG